MASVCSHLSWVRQPTKGGLVHKEECTQCFHQDSAPGGVDVCLTCFNGGCTGEGSQQHSARHAQLCHPLVLNIQKKDIVKAQGDANMDMDGAGAAASSSSAAAAATPATKQTISDKIAELENAEPTFFYETTVRCLACKVTLQPSETESLRKCVEAVLEAQSASRATEVALVSEEIEENCPHCVNLKQVDNAPQLGERTLSTCACCDVKDKMWLCLTCGVLGCSRRQMISAGEWSVGNAHAVAHSEATGHPVVLKVGTLNAEGRGDCYCYRCNNSINNRDLAKQVATFGIIVGADTVATEQTTQDAILALNMNMNWSLVFEESGKEAELAFGPGHTGLANLGNSCYLASVLQVLFSLPNFQERYFGPAENHLRTCNSPKPSECFACQMSKLALGMLSGRYDPAPSAADLAVIVAQRAAREERQKAIKEGKAVQEEEKTPQKKALQQGVAPRMFKRLVAGKHPEFSSGRQQDSFEYLHFLLDFIKQKEHAAGFDPYSLFTFQQEDRLECNSCHRVRYQTGRNTELQVPIPLPAALPPKPVPEPKAGEKAPKPAPKEYPPVSFKSCVDEWAHTSTVEDWVCPHCKVVRQGSKSSRLATFPPVLVVHMRRFVYEGWVPEKLDIEVQLTDAPEQAGQQAIVDLNALRAKGLQAGEQELPKDASAGNGPSAPVASPAIVSSLEGMGFSTNACKRAALAVDNASADAASNWLFAHMEDANINDPLPAPAAAAGAGSSSSGPEPSAEAVSNLEMMGFDSKRCRYALKQCGNSADRAVEWLFSHADDPIPEERAASSAASSEGKQEEIVIDQAPAGYELFAFVNHMGKSTGSGHYVAHVKKNGRWVQFNDQKVSFVTAPLRAAAFAYLLFFRRIQQ